jgi:hypothetical protein
MSVITIGHIKFLEHASNAPLRSIAAQCLFTALILAFARRHTFVPGENNCACVSSLVAACCSEDWRNNKF